MVGVQSNNKYLELDSYPEDKHQARLYAYQALNIYKASIYVYYRIVNKRIFIEKRYILNKFEKERNDMKYITCSN